MLKIEKLFAPMLRIFGLSIGLLAFYCFLTSSVVIFGGVKATVAYASDTPLAYEPFDGTVGDDVSTLNDGFGWGGTWVDQTNSDPPGPITIANTAPLSYETLSMAGNYVSGGNRHTFRPLDLSANGPFASYLTTSGKIGKPGTSLWLSALVRKDVWPGGGLNIGFANSWDRDDLWVGQQSGTATYWSLLLGGDGTNQVVTSVPVTAGQVELMVLHITFGTPNDVNDPSTLDLYHNPYFIGGIPPAQPDKTISSTEDVTFNGVNVLISNQGSVDEIRVGDSFAAVTQTPSDAEAPSVPANLAASEITSNSISLTWDASSDNLGTVEYNIFQGTTQIGTTKETNFEVTGLDQLTSYTFQVDAVDPAGNTSDKSATLSATTISPDPITISVDKTLEYNRIDGFGVQPSPSYTTYPDMMINDLGATIFRISLPDSFEEVNDNNDPNVLDENSNLNLDGSLDDPNNINGCTSSSYTVDKQISMVQSFQNSAAKYGVPIQFIGTTWSPPYWMKLNNCLTDGGNSNSIWNTLAMAEISSDHNPPDERAEFAEYIYAYLKVLQENGIDLSAMSIQNEPAYNETYPSAIYSPDQYTTTLKAVAAKLSQEGIATKLIGPEDDGHLSRMLSYMTSLGQDSAALNDLGMFAQHGYEHGDGYLPGTAKTEDFWTQMFDAANQYNKPLWQTEISGFDQTWDGAMSLATDMNTQLKYGRLGAYLWFTPNNTSQPQYALLIPNSGGTPAPTYYAFKQYSKYILPGSIQVDSQSSDSDVVVISYVQPDDKKLTTVLVNNGDNDKLASFTYTGGNLPTQYEEYRSSSTEDAVDIGAVSSTDAVRIPAHSIVTLQGDEPTADAPLAPTIQSQPQSATVSEENSAIFTVGASGTPDLTYQWYKDGTLIAGVNGNNLTLKAVTSQDAGDYTVKVTNDAGSLTSAVATLTVTPFAGMQIVKTSAAPVIDGTADTLWDNVPSYNMANIMDVPTGSNPPTAQQHAGSVQAMWDNTNLYYLAKVTDDNIANGGTITTHDDVEVYIDGDNSKGTSYDSNDFQLVFNYDDTQSVKECQGGKCNTISGVSYKTIKTADGYQMEMEIPWTTLGVTPTEGMFIGVDASSDRDDGTGHEADKIAWNMKTDNDWQSPSYFGIAELMNLSESQVGFTDDFEDGNANGWAVESGAWNVVTDGSYQYESGASGIQISSRGDNTWTDYTIEATVKPSSANTEMSLLGRFADTYNYYWFGYNSGGYWQIAKAVDNVGHVLTYLPESITANQEYDLKAVMIGSTLQLYVNGVLKLETTDTTFTSGRMALKSQNGVDEFDNVSVQLAPTIQTQPQSYSVSAGGLVTITVSASGTPDLSYQWYKDGTPISGGTGSALTLGSVTTQDAGNYTVTISNSAGSVTSSTATLTVTPFAGMQIVNTATAPVIDGTADAVWDNIPSYNMANIMDVPSGSNPPTAQQHAGSVQAMWDDTNLYYLAKVTDDNIANGGTTTTNDDVEVYIDGDNSKGTSYDANDFQLVFNYDDTQSVKECQDGSCSTITGVLYKTIKTTDGYQAEIEIPWTSLGVTPTAGMFIGADTASDRDDGTGLKADKIAWNMTVDDDWQNPSYFGIAELVEPQSESQVGFTDDFEDGNANGWTVETGAWNVVTDGSYQYESGASGIQISSRGDNTWTNYTVEATVKPSLANTELSLLGRFADTYNYYWFGYSKSGYWQIAEVVNNVGHIITYSSPESITANQEYDLKAVMSGNTLQLYVNGVLKLETTDTTFTSGRMALRSQNGTAEFDNVSVQLAPTIRTQPQNASVSAGGSATFSVDASGTPDLSYQWYKDGTLISGATGSALTLVSVTSQDAGNYTVTITNTVGSVTSSAATLTVM